MQNEKQTLRDLIVGTLFFVLLFLLGNFIIENHLAYTLGLLLGGVVSIGMSFHMYSSLQKAILYDGVANWNFDACSDIFMSFFGDKTK